MSASEDLDVLARLVFGEARGESLEGKIAVAWVVVNRTKRPARFGYTITEVARKPLQFSCFNPNDPNYGVILAANVEQKAYLACLGAAALVLSGAVPDPTKGSDHYLTTALFETSPPGWVSLMTLTVKIGAHQFLRELPVA